MFGPTDEDGLRDEDKLDEWTNGERDIQLSRLTKANAGSAHDGPRVYLNTTMKRRINSLEFTFLLCLLLGLSLIHI